MLIKIFSGSHIENLNDEIQSWLDEVNDNASDGDMELQIISVTQSEGDGIINLTVIVK